MHTDGIRRGRNEITEKKMRACIKNFQLGKKIEVPEAKNEERKKIRQLGVPR